MAETFTPIDLSQHSSTKGGYCVQVNDNGDDKFCDHVLFIPDGGHICEVYRKPMAGMFRNCCPMSTNELEKSNKKRKLNPLKASKRGAGVLR